MWIISTFLVFLFFSKCYAVGTVVLQNLKLVGSTYGDQCYDDSNIDCTVCLVDRTEEATFLTNITIDGGYIHKSLKYLRLTLKWENKKTAVIRARACPESKDTLVLNRECFQKNITEGTYSLEPISIIIPEPGEKGTKKLRMYADLTWCDKNNLTNVLLGTILAIIL